MATISSWLCSREWHSNGNSGVGSIGWWDAFGPNSGLDSSRVNREVSSAGGAEGGGGFGGAVHTDAYAGRLLLATHTPPPPSCSMVSGRAAARELWTAVVRVSSPPVMTMHCGWWVLAIACETQGEKKRTSTRAPVVSESSLQCWRRSCAVG